MYKLFILYFQTLNQEQKENLLLYFYDNCRLSSIAPSKEAYFIFLKNFDKIYI
jgi:predicted DNA-binding protein YlxM (UPF0122 family)